MSLDELLELFDKGKYEEVIDEVNSMYGWNKGELPCIYTREVAEWSIKQFAPFNEFVSLYKSRFSV